MDDTGRRDSKRVLQFGMGRLLVLIGCLAVLLGCFVNFCQASVGVDGQADRLFSLPGNAWLWLFAGFVPVTAGVVFVFRRRLRTTIVSSAIGLMLTFLLFVSGSQAFSSIQNRASPRSPAIALSNNESMEIVIRATTHFLETESAWPRTRAELLASSSDPALGEALDKVKFDFNANIGELATQTWHEFTAIRPGGPSYNYYHDEMQRLIDQLKNMK